MTWLKMAVYLMFMVLTFLMFFVSSHLLNILIILEIMTFTIMSMFLVVMNMSLYSNLMALIMFTVFVLESVMGLAGLISMVYFTGKDYLLTCSIIN